VSSAASAAWSAEGESGERLRGRDDPADDVGAPMPEELLEEAPPDDELLDDGAAPDDELLEDGAAPDDELLEEAPPDDELLDDAAGPSCELSGRFEPLLQPGDSAARDQQAAADANQGKERMVTPRSVILRSFSTRRAT
jgi:hypothetical protein